MKALFVIHTPKDPRTAVFKIVSKQADALRARGHSIDILAPEDFALTRAAGARFDVLLFPVLLAHWLLERGCDYDVIKFHSYSGWLIALLRPLIRSWRTLRIITEFHGLQPLYFAATEQESQLSGHRLSLRYRVVNGWFTRKILRTACSRADWVLCLNSNELLFLTQNRWATSARVHLFSNGVPPEFFGISRFYEKAKTLLFVGQWIDIKGIRYLVDAFSQIADRYPSLQLLCVGTSISADDVQSCFPAGIRHRVTVESSVDRARLAELHRLADVFVFPTLFEGFSLALLEAMASALPIVASSVGAAPDLLHHLNSAFLIPPGDTGALVDGLRTLIDNPDLRTSLGMNARAAAEHYSSAIVLSRNVNRIEELVSSAPEPTLTSSPSLVAPIRN